MDMVTDEEVIIDLVTDEEIIIDLFVVEPKILVLVMFGLLFISFGMVNVFQNKK